MDLPDVTHPLRAAAVLRLFPARPHLLALGEPTHGEDMLLDLRNRLFRQLVEEAGYRTIAWRATAWRDCSSTTTWPPAPAAWTR